MAEGFQDSKTPDYRNLLWETYQIRFLKNDKYSLRAYARDLGLSSQMLSQILKGRKGLSLKTAQAVLGNLRLQDLDAQIFIASVLSTHSRQKDVKSKFFNQLKELKALKEFGTIPSDDTNLSLNWHTLPVFMLVKSETRTENCERISARLGLPQNQVEFIIQSLINQKVLEMKQNLVCKRKEFASIKFSESTKDVRRLHQEIISKANTSVDSVPVEKRDLSAGFLFLSKSQFAEAQQKIKKFRQSLIQEMSSKASSEEDIYCVSMQLFPIEKMETLK